MTQFRRAFVWAAVAAAAAPALPTMAAAAPPARSLTPALLEWRRIGLYELKRLDPEHEPARRALAAYLADGTEPAPPPA